MMTNLRTSLVAASLLALGSFSSAASADSHRPGLVIGGAITGGHMGCETSDGDDCGDGAHPAGGFSLHLGGMATPALAVMGELWGMRHDDDNWRASQVFLTANLRAFVVPRLWLQGGFGAARTQVELDAGPLTAMDETDTVPAFVVGAGVELVQTPTFGLDLQLRGGSGFYNDDTRIWNTAIGVGATWY